MNKLSTVMMTFGVGLMLGSGFFSLTHSVRMVWGDVDDKKGLVLVLSWLPFSIAGLGLTVGGGLLLLAGY